MSDNSSPYLSIIVPAYNESATIAVTLARVKMFLDAQSYSYQVIICADGTDGTRERAAEFAGSDPGWIVLGSAQRGGKGKAVREGVFRATGQIVGFIDADYKTPIEELKKLLPYLEGGADVVIGSRRMGAAEIQVPQPLYRRWGSWAFGAVMRRMIGLQGIRDTQCGFKFFRHEAGKRLFSLQRVDGYMFDVEILRLARLLDLRIQEVGVCWRDDGDSRYNPIIGTWRNARDLLRIRGMKYDLSEDAPYSSIEARRAA